MLCLVTHLPVWPSFQDSFVCFILLIQFSRQLCLFHSAHSLQLIGYATPSCHVPILFSLLANEKYAWVAMNSDILNFFKSTQRSQVSYSPGVPLSHSNHINFYQVAIITHFVRVMVYVGSRLHHRFLQ